MLSRNLTPTTDKTIRSAFREDLTRIHGKDSNAIIIDELGITHGTARVDVAVLDGSIQGYELKSDSDTLNRLPEQMRVYNTVLDRITLVVGKTHLLAAINMIPEWWGITLAKPSASDGVIRFFSVRDADENPEQDTTAMVSLLWRGEALRILEENNCADGIRSKPRAELYNRLAELFDRETLREKVRECLAAREGWRSGKPHTLSGD